MHEIIDKILICNKNICKNIAKITPSERGFFSQNILGELRNFLEAINMFFYANSQKNNKIEYTYQNITKANSYVKTQANLYVLNKLHQLLQISASHYTLEEENSERLMLKYYEYLLKIKKLLAPFNITILSYVNIQNKPNCVLIQFHILIVPHPRYFA